MAKNHEAARSPRVGLRSLNGCRGPQGRTPTPDGGERRGKCIVAPDREGGEGPCQGGVGVWAYACDGCVTEVPPPPLSTRKVTSLPVRTPPACESSHPGGGWSWC